MIVYQWSFNHIRAITSNQRGVVLKPEQQQSQASARDPAFTFIEVGWCLASVSTAVGAAFPGGGTVLVGGAALHTGCGKAGGALRRRAVSLAGWPERGQELPARHTLRLLLRERTGGNVITAVHTRTEIICNVWRHMWGLKNTQQVNFGRNLPTVKAAAEMWDERVCMSARLAADQPNVNRSFS